MSSLQPSGFTWTQALGDRVLKTRGSLGRLQQRRGLGRCSTMCRLERQRCWMHACLLLLRLALASFSLHIASSKTTNMCAMAAARRRAAVRCNHQRACNLQGWLSDMLLLHGLDATARAESICSLYALYLSIFNFSFR